MYLNNKESAKADPNQIKYTTMTDVKKDFDNFIKNINKKANETGVEDYSIYTLHRLYVHKFDKFYELSDGYVITILTNDYPYKAFFHDDNIEVYTYLSEIGLSNIKGILSEEEYEVVR